MIDSISVLVLGVILALPSQAAALTGRVVKVSDCDTITALEGTTQHKIRLMGIDAPEKAQSFGNRFKIALGQQRGRQNCRGQVQHADRGQRIIGKVTYLGY